MKRYTFYIALLSVIAFICCSGQRFASYNNKLVAIENKISKKVIELTSKVSNTKDTEKIKEAFSSAVKLIDDGISEIKELEAPEEGKELKEGYIKFFQKIKKEMKIYSDRLTSPDFTMKDLNNYTSKINEAADELQELQKEIAKKYNVEIKE